MLLRLWLIVMLNKFINASSIVLEFCKLRIEAPSVVQDANRLVILSSSAVVDAWNKVTFVFIVPRDVLIVPIEVVCDANVAPSVVQDAIRLVLLSSSAVFDVCNCEVTFVYVKVLIEVVCVANVAPSVVQDANGLVILSSSAVLDACNEVTFVLIVPIEIV